MILNSASAGDLNQRRRNQRTPSQCGGSPTGTFSDSSTQTLASVLWSTSSTTVAPVTGDSTNAGVAVSAAQGTTTITASAAGIAGSTTLTVTAAALSSITLSPQDSVIALGGTQQFTATGNY